MSLKQIAMVSCWLGMLGVDAGRARADDIEDFGPRRELAGHVFFPSLIIANPFLSTYIGVESAAGYEWIDGPGFDLFGNLSIGRRSYRAAAMAQGVTFQANLNNYLAIRFAGGGGVDGGTNGPSAVVVGMNQPITAGGGVTLGWKLGDTGRLGFTFDFVYSHTRLIRPLVAIQDSLVARDVELAAVSQKLDGYTLLPGIALAIAPSPTAGFLVSANYSWTTQVDDTTQHFHYVNVGASAQLDLLPASMIPLGLLASYRATIPFESEVRFTNTVEGGLFYTGRKDLDLGLDAQVKWFDLQPEHRIRLDTTQVTGVIEVRYHWN
jgi:hypothetical protein